jgi:STE24 endopeptidase
MGLPWSWYVNFVIKEKHGFNQMTFGIFIMDTLKSMIIVVILILIVTPLVVKIMEFGGENFYIYMFIFIVIFSLIMLWIVPNFIMPLFNKYEEIEEGELKTKIYALAGKLNFPLKKLFIMDASKRSTQSNAFFFGIGSNKRIVLFDNLKSHLETDEIVAVVAHELGHWSMYHTILQMIYGFASIFLTFYVFSFVIHRDDILIDFGFSKHYNIVSLLVFMEIYSPVEYLQKLLQTFFTRVLEFQADRFARDLGYKKDLMKGLIRLHIKNKANLNPDPLYATYHFSHPELIERLKALGDYYDVITVKELEKKEEEAKLLEEKAKVMKEKLSTSDEKKDEVDSSYDKLKTE